MWNIILITLERNNSAQATILAIAIESCLGKKMGILGHNQAHIVLWNSYMRRCKALKYQSDIIRNLQSNRDFNEIKNCRQVLCDSNNHTTIENVDTINNPICMSTIWRNLTAEHSIQSSYARKTIIHYYPPVSVSKPPNRPDLFVGTQNQPNSASRYYSMDHPNINQEPIWFVCKIFLSYSSQT